MIHPYTYAGLTSQKVIAKDYLAHSYKDLFDKLAHVVEQQLGVSRQDLLHGSRERHNVDARKIVTHIMKTKTSIGWMKLGSIMNLHHATIIFQKNNTDDLLKYEPAFQKKYNLVILAFENQLTIS